MPEGVINPESAQLPVGPIGRLGVGWWGVGTLVASEAALFSYLLFSYYYTGATGDWLAPGARRASMLRSPTRSRRSPPASRHGGEWGVLSSRRPWRRCWVWTGVPHGDLICARPAVRVDIKPFNVGTSNSLSLDFLTTGIHIAHVVVGLLVLLSIFLWVSLDYFSPRRRLSVSAGVLYWHFVDIVWLFVFTTYYLTPYLGFAQ